MLHPAQIRSPAPGMTLSQSSAPIRVQHFRCCSGLALEHQLERLPRRDCCPGPPLGQELELEHRSLVHFLRGSPQDRRLDQDQGLHRGLDPCRSQEDQSLWPGPRQAWR